MSSYADQIRDIRKRRQQGKAPAKGTPSPLAPRPANQSDPQEGSVTPRPANQSETKEGHIPTGKAPAHADHKPTKKPTKTPAAPVDPAAAQLDQDAAAAVRMRFGGQEKEIAGQQRVSDQMQTNIGSWFDQYKADVEAARQRTADVNQGIQIAQAQQAQQAQAADTAAATTPEAQQAAAARRSTSDSFGSMLAANAGAENAYQADKGRIGSGQAVQEHLNEAGRKRSLADALKDLVGQKGDYETQYRADRKAADRKAALEDAAFGLDQEKAQSDAELKKAAQESLTADRKTDNKRAAAKDKSDKMKDDRQYRLDKAKYGDAKAKDNYQKANGLGPYKPAAGPKGKSEADKRADAAHKESVRTKSGDALTRIDDAKSAWDDLKKTPYATGEKDKDGHDVLDPKTNTPKTRTATDEEVRAELRRQHFTANEIHLALAPKPWGPQEIAMAHKLHIRIPRSYLPAKSKGPGTVKAPDGNGQSRPT